MGGVKIERTEKACGLKSTRLCSVEQTAQKEVRKLETDLESKLEGWVRLLARS